MNERTPPLETLYRSLFNDLSEAGIEDVRRLLDETRSVECSRDDSLPEMIQALVRQLDSTGSEIPEFMRNLSDQLSNTGPASSRGHASTQPGRPASKRNTRQWTNESVRRLAGDRDPIEYIVERARALVTKALDQDWFGPPFDPMALAGILGYEVRPVADVPEARTVPAAEEKFRIEFNPNRPVGRVRYSLAHEIAHTIFPDCAERIRNRVAHANTTADEWQLEALCNIAAAEILMPFGTFPTPTAELISINRVRDLQKQYRVSTEALLLRIVHLAPITCAVFSASQFESGKNRGKWRLDYVVGSPHWDVDVSKDFVPPADTCLRECERIGFTTSREETWSGSKLRVEAIALPPYPGAIMPRVAGFLIAEDQQEYRANTLTEVAGDALRPRGDGRKLVIHVVPDRAQTWGGRGFASAVRRKWPQVHEDFSSWAGLHGRNLALGKVRFCDAEANVRVASMVAQHGYGPARGQRLRYEALAACIGAAFKAAAGAGETVHLPRIGTGHGGGSWLIIRDILQEAVSDSYVDATVYRLPWEEPEPQQIALGITRPER